MASATPSETASKRIVWAHVDNPQHLSALREVAYRLREFSPDLEWVFTVPEGAGFGDKAVQEINLSSAAAAQKWVNKLHPALCFWSASIISAATFNQCHRLGIPVMVANPDIAGLKKRSWLWRQTSMRPALRPVTQYFAAQHSDLAGLRSVGVASDKVKVTGPLVEGGIPLKCDPTERDQFGATLSSRPVWFAANVPEAELFGIFSALATAQRSAHRLCFILDLADLSLINQVAETLSNKGYIVHQRAVEGEPDERTQVFLADGPEDLGLWYRLAALTFMGGTFSDQPCLDPMAPAALGSAILHGKKINNHHDAYARLALGGATLQVSEPGNLGTDVARALAPDQSALMAQAGWLVISQGAEVIDTLVEAIAELFPGPDA